MLTSLFWRYLLQEARGCSIIMDGWDVIVSRSPITCPAGI